MPNTYFSRHADSSKRYFGDKRKSKSGCPSSSFVNILPMAKSSMLGVNGLNLSVICAKLRFRNWRFKMIWNILIDCLRYLSVWFLILSPTFSLNRILTAIKTNRTKVKIKRSFRQSLALKWVNADSDRIDQLSGSLVSRVVSLGMLLRLQYQFIKNDNRQ